MTEPTLIDTTMSELTLMGSINPNPGFLSLSDMREELRLLVEDLTGRSLSKYAVYMSKEVDALQYLADPTADVPFLVSEANMRGMTTLELANLIKGKALAMRSFSRGIELLLLELNQDYNREPNKLALRDRLLSKAKSLAPS